MNRNRIGNVCTCCILLTVARGPSPTTRILASDEMLDLSDVAWSVGDTRVETSVKREIAACVGVTDGIDEDFKSEAGPFSIVSLSLKAQKDGKLALVPELFLVRDGGLYGVYRPCRGIRFVVPPPDARAAAFHPPSDGSQWPGHAGWIHCRAGDTVVIGLLFDHIVRDDAQILAAAPVVSPRRPRHGQGSDGREGDRKTQVSQEH